MNLTNGEIWTASVALGQLGRRHLEIPQLGKYRLSRLEKDLAKTYAGIEARRIALIQAHGSESFSDETKTLSQGWTVQQGTEGHKAYVAAWDALCAESQDVEVSPIPLTALGDSPNALEFGEISALDRLLEA